MNDLTHLGKVSPIPTSPHAATIDVVDNPSYPIIFTARFTCPEMTSCCPVTGQPDFATIVIDYVPLRKLIESKSLKLFIFSFRNHAGFHEYCTTLIGERLAQVCEPHWLRVSGYWNARGGIPIDVFYEWGNLPENVHIPDHNVPFYRVRG